MVSGSGIDKELRAAAAAVDRHNEALLAHGQRERTYLRDLFAAAALAGRLASGATVWTLTAKECYQAADLMLEQRGATDGH